MDSSGTQTCLALFLSRTTDRRICSTLTARSLQGPYECTPRGRPRPLAAKASWGHGPVFLQWLPFGSLGPVVDMKEMIGLVEPTKLELKALLDVPVLLHLIHYCTVLYCLDDSSCSSSVSLSSTSGGCGSCSCHLTIHLPHNHATQAPHWALQTCQSGTPVVLSVCPGWQRHKVRVGALYHEHGALQVSHRGGCWDCTSNLPCSCAESTAIARVLCGSLARHHVPPVVRRVVRTSASVRVAASPPLACTMAVPCWPIHSMCPTGACPCASSLLSTPELREPRWQPRRNHSMSPSSACPCSFLSAQIA